MILGIDEMAIFLGTVIIVGLCCLALGLGQMIAGRPLTGGCGKTKPGVPRCAGCPKRSHAETTVENHGGESGC
jgi:hypothetical protein